MASLTLAKACRQDRQPGPLQKGGAICAIGGRLVLLLLDLSNQVGDEFGVVFLDQVIDGRFGNA